MWRSKKTQKHDPRLDFLRCSSWSQDSSQASQKSPLAIRVLLVLVVLVSVRVLPFEVSELDVSDLSWRHCGSGGGGDRRVGKRDSAGVGGVFSRTGQDENEQTNKVRGDRWLIPASTAASATWALDLS